MDNTTIVDILLVEDSRLDAEMMVRALRRQKITNSISIMEDGAQALDFMFCRGEYAGRDSSSLPRVILLDLKLPKVNGLEVLKLIKSEERLRSVPVVVVTSSQEDPDIKTAYALGANSYVVKPVSSAAFIDAMSNLGMYWVLVNQPPK